MRFLSHVIAVRRVKRAGAATETDPLEFAQPAFAFELLDIAQATEDLRVLPNVAHRLALHVAGADGQITARENLARVRHETNRAAGQAAFGHRRHVRTAAATAWSRMRPVAAGLHVPGFAVAVRGFDADVLGGGALAHDAEIMRRASRFEMKRALLALVVHPVEHALVFLGGQHVRLGDLHAATDGHQHEQVQRVGAKFLGHRVERLDLVQRCVW